MYNYNKLKGLIKEHYDTQEAFAKALGIGITTLHSRLNGSTYFNQREIEKSKKLLSLDSTSVNEVFFIKK